MSGYTMGKTTQEANKEKHMTTVPTFDGLLALYAPGDGERHGPLASHWREFPDTTEMQELLRHVATETRSLNAGLTVAADAMLNIMANEAEVTRKVSEKPEEYLRVREQIRFDSEIANAVYDLNPAHPLLLAYYHITDPIDHNEAMANAMERDADKLRPTRASSGQERV